MSGKMKAVTITVFNLKNKKKSEYICQVFPVFNTAIIYNQCDERDDIKEKIKNSAKWAVRNNLSKASIKVG